LFSNIVGQIEGMIKAKLRVVNKHRNLKKSFQQ